MNRSRARAALTLAAAYAIPPHATDMTLGADRQWAPVGVDSFAAPSFGLDWIDDTDCSSLAFWFGVAAGFPAQRTGVDRTIAGNTFSVTYL